MLVSRGSTGHGLCVEAQAQLRMCRKGVYERPETFRVELYVLTEFLAVG